MMLGHIKPVWSYVEAALGPSWGDMGHMLRDFGPTWGQMANYLHKMFDKINKNSAKYSLFVHKPKHS